MEDEHGPCALADDEVALPMTRLGSGVDIFGPFMDGDAILYGISRRPRSARAAAFVTSREITPQLLGLLGGAVDEGVDRLAAHGPAHGVRFRLSASPQFARASTLLRGGRERSSARLGLSRSSKHARWAAYCGLVRARSSTLDGGSPERWRPSNGPGPSTNQSVLFRHLTNANSRAWQHSLRSRSCRYQIGPGCCTSRQNSGRTFRSLYCALRLRPQIYR